MDPNVITAVVLAGIGGGASGIAWVVGLKGRVDAHDQLFTEREKQSEMTELVNKERYLDLKADLRDIKEIIRKV